MLTMYYKPSCPFCRRVMAVIDRLDIEVELKDISENNDFAEELIARGGKRQVPYLVDTDKSIEMYESDDIVSHLQSNYGQSTATSTKPRVHISNSTCESCEG